MTPTIERFEKRATICQHDAAAAFKRYEFAMRDGDHAAAIHFQSVARAEHWEAFDCLQYCIALRSGQ